MVNPLSHQVRAQKLGALIQEARSGSGRAEEECASYMGVSLASYQAYEQGEKAPSLPELEVLAFYLDIPIEHFLGQESLLAAQTDRAVLDKLENLLTLRHRIIGVLLRKARLEAGISVQELAKYAEIDPEKIEAYELGELPVPLTELEVITLALNLSLREFQDRSGPVGKWAIQKKSVEGFLELPLELQQFISKPINLPYLELAQRLSGMSVERLRGVAEGLLEITL